MSTGLGGSQCQGAGNSTKRSWSEMAEGVRETNEERWSYEEKEGIDICTVLHHNLCKKRPSSIFEEVVWEPRLLSLRLFSTLYSSSLRPFLILLCSVHHLVSTIRRKKYTLEIKWYVPQITAGNGVQPSLARQWWWRGFYPRLQWELVGSAISGRISCVLFAILKH